MSHEAAVKYLIDEDVITDTLTLSEALRIASDMNLEQSRSCWGDGKTSACALTAIAMVAHRMGKL